MEVRSNLSCSRRNHMPPTASDQFRANKQPHELSASERLLRTENAGADAFCFFPQRSFPTSPRRLSRSDCVERRRGTVLGLGPLDRQRRTKKSMRIDSLWPSTLIVLGAFSILAAFRPFLDAKR
ncbi:hypothetical protein F4859DRAFT_336119 [Xylaria cf. heliscus]|nr:hypothetical protein F4859DRAFT_336119 [Xylaria cf. heliscus]